MITEKEDIEELTSMFKDMLGKSMGEEKAPFDQSKLKLDRIHRGQF